MKKEGEQKRKDFIGRRHLSWRDDITQKGDVVEQGAQN